MIKQFVNKNFKWVCHHAHIDKSQLISKNLLDKSNTHMCEKWYIMKDLKKSHEVEQLFFLLKGGLERDITLILEI